MPVSPTAPRHTPHPLNRAHTTPPGALLSLCAVSFMALLFSVELMAFVSVASQTQVLLDTNSEQHLRINFNVTLMDLHCDYAAVDVVDVLGTNSMNVTSHIDKWLLNSDGVRMLFHGRNREQKDIAHDDHLHPDIETLHENGEHAVPVGDKSFDQFVGENPYVGGGAAAAAASTTTTAPTVLLLTLRPPRCCSYSYCYYYYYYSHLHYR